MRQTPVVLAFIAVACGGEPPVPIAESAAMQDSTSRVAVVTGLSGPEAVRYDSIADVWFVANFNGESAGDANGFISRVLADGTIDSLRFMVGSELAPLHGPRGMYIVGDTLWAADAEGVHGFDRTTGAHLVFHDFTSLEPSFLNDIALGADGALYVTDTGRGRIYRIANGEVTVAIEGGGLVTPNGITPDTRAAGAGGAAGAFLVAGWNAGNRVQSWNPASGEIADVGMANTGRFDGIEVVDGRIIVASQSDSSLHAIADSTELVIIRTPGAPADIGVDTRRARVAVPYIALNRVDIWQITAARPPSP
ncbi:MAG TPA: hypothetical protein VFM71_07560 [Gemmatimonadaceae bacterium]|nr:hypothetical protein [Gemmatimonadaceae bacterium]